MFVYMIVGIGALVLLDSAITGKHPVEIISAAFGGNISLPHIGGLSDLPPELQPNRTPDGTFGPLDNVSSKNLIEATAVQTAVQARFPSAKFAGICNCRKQRGTGSDPNRWSVHSVCGAVDFFTDDPAAMIAFAKAIPGVWDAWLDAKPGDVHIQIIPNPPANWIPPCATGKQPL